MAELTPLQKIFIEQGISPDAMDDKDIGEGIRATENIRLIDQDTGVFTDEEGNDNTVRFSGLGSLETSHLDPNTLRQSSFDIGGQSATELGVQAIQDQGFETPVLTGKQGFFGRDLGDAVNPEGMGYNKYMLRSGAAPLGLYASQDDVETTAIGRLDRFQRRATGNVTEWDKKIQRHNKFVAQGGISMKPLAINEAAYAAGPEFYSGVSNSRNDRTDMNETKSWQIDDAWSMGYNNGLLGASTSIGMAGDMVGIDSISNFGYGHADAIKREISDAPWLRDMEAFDENGDWTFDGVSEFTNYLFSNLAASTPVMGVTMIAALTAPMTYGASLAVPVAIYSGQNYDAQEVKNKGTAVTYALGMTALDLLSARLGGLMTGFKPTPLMAKQISSKEGREELTDFVVDAAGVTRQEASQALGKSVQDAAQNATEVSKRLFDKMGAWAMSTGRVGKAGLQGMTAEGLTEAMQEYLAIQAEDNNISPEEMLNRLMNAGFAGGMLGGGFSVVGYGAQALNTKQGVVGLEQASKEGLIERTQARDKLRTKNDKKKGSHVLTEEEILEQHMLEANLDDRGLGGEGKDKTWKAPLESQATAKKTGEEKNNIDKFTDFLPRLVRQQVIDAVGKFQDSHFMGVIGTLIGANQSRAMLAFEEAKRKLTADYTGVAEFDSILMSSNSEHRNPIAFSKALYAKQKLIKELFRTTNKKYEGMHDLKGRPTVGNLSEVNVDNNLGFSKPEMEFLQQVYEKSIKAGKGVDLMNKTVNRHSVYKNSAKFEALLVKHAYLTPEEAHMAVSAFLQNTEYSSPLDVISTATNSMGFLDVSGNYNPQTTLESIPGAEAFIENNIFTNIVTNATKIAAESVEADYFGKNGKKLASLLDSAFDAGEINENEKIEIAGKLLDYYKQVKGNYKRVDSKAYRSFVNNISFLTMLTALPLAAVQSLVEIGFVLYQNNPKSMATALKMSSLAAKEIQATMNEGLTTLSNGKIPMKDYTHRRELRSLGYLLDQQAPAARQGAELSPLQSMFGAAFFKASGLTGLTNLQRATRLSMAEDTVHHWLDQLVTHEGTGNKFENEANDQLSRLGVDSQYLIKAHELHRQMVDVEGYKRHVADRIFTSEEYVANMDRAKIRFIDSAIVMPAVANRPKYYQDSRFKLFTQFQGYISGATAVLLPIMYGNLGGQDKLPKARVDALKTIASLLALSFLAYSIKDSAKVLFADDETKKRKEEYLTDWQKFIRTIYGSGAIGVLERPIDAIMPLYGQRSTFTGRAAAGIFGDLIRTPVNTVVSESPGLSWLDSGFGAVEALVTDDPNTLRKFAKITPYFGPFADSIQPYIKE